MPRLSVYVSDDLWQRAIHAGATESPSQLVQKALNRLVSEAARRDAPFRVAAPTNTKRLSEIAARKRAEATEHYRLGYEAGLKIAELLPWGALDRFSEVDFDLRDLEESEWDQLTAEHALLLDPAAFYRDFSRDSAYGEGKLEGEYLGTVFALGRRDALRDVWNAVMAEESASTSEPEEKNEGERPSRPILRSVETDDDE